MLSIKNYVRAQSAEEAYNLNQKRNNRIIGGMLWLKMQTGNIDTAIDLCDLGLNTIEETDAEFSIGCMATLRQLEQHEGLNLYSSHAVENAVKDIVGVQFRNLATVGGSLWGRFGFSDVLSVFLVMDSYVELYKGGIIPLSTFASMNPDNDILLRLIIKKTPGQFRYSAMRVQRTDFPILTCALAQINNTYHLAIGSRPGRAVLLTDSNGILCNGISVDSAKSFADYAASQIETSSNLRGSKEYRTHLIRVLTERNLLAMGGLI